MRIFGDPGVLDSVDSAPQVKEETLNGYGQEFERGASGGAFRGSSSRASYTVGVFKVVIVAEEEIVVENAVFIVSALDI